MNYEEKIEYAEAVVNEKGVSIAVLTLDSEQIGSSN